MDEVKVLHSLDDILAIYRLSLLLLRYLTAFACDKGDELTDAFLHALAGLLRNFGVTWQRVLHYPVDVSYW